VFEPWLCTGFVLFLQNMMNCKKYIVQLFSLLLLVVPLQFVYDGVGKSTFDASLNCLDYLGWLISFGNASGKPDPFDVLRCATAAAAAV
jgi:uncharacterized membrane protein